MGSRPYISIRAVHWALFQLFHTGNGGVFFPNKKHDRGTSYLAIFGVMTFCDDLLRACTTDDNDLTREFNFLFGMGDRRCCLCTLYFFTTHMTLHLTLGDGNI
jgi:hypothetical protein